MRITVKVGVLLAAIWMLFKVLYHLFFPETTDLTVSIFINMFLLISSISLGLYLQKKKEGDSQGNALSDIKSGMTCGVPYAVLVSIFMYVYYTSINPSYIENIRKPFVEKLKEDLSTEKKIAKLKKINPELETKTKEEIYKEGLKNIQFQTNPKSTSIISLLALILLTTFYSIIITVILRKTIFGA
jgi:predicted permease